VRKKGHTNTLGRLGPQEITRQAFPKDECNVLLATSAAEEGTDTYTHSHVHTNAQTPTERSLRLERPYIAAIQGKTFYEENTFYFNSGSGLDVISFRNHYPPMTCYTHARTHTHTHTHTHTRIGLDFPACNAVIMMDGADSIALKQREGRVRADGNVVVRL
jgi:hypothetical protein